MQRILRAVAYTTNGLLLVVPGILGLAALFTSDHRLVALFGGIALFAGLNLYVMRAAVQPQVEREREHSYRQQIAQADSLRKLSINAERVVLPARVSFFLMAWLFCIVFVALIVFLHHVDRMSLWPAVIFVVGVLYFPIAMVPGASYIEINEQGIVFSSAFIKNYYPWFKIADLQVIPYVRREGVGIRYKPEYQKHSAYQILNRKMQGGFDRVIVSYHCGVEASELLQLMRSFHNRALNEAATVDGPVSPKVS